jgi:protein SCO1/2
VRLLPLVVALMMAGCSRTPTKTAEPAESAAAEERHELRGEVVSVNREERTLRIKHEEIAGWMEAMTMDFPVQDQSELDKVKPGDRITATVFVRDLDYHVGNLQVQPGK